MKSNNQEKKELIVTQKIYIETCREGITVPEYTNNGEMIISAAEELTILPGETKIIPTGLKMIIPEGFELLIIPRNELSLNTPLRIFNSPILINDNYQDEVGIIIHNSSTIQSYNRHYPLMTDNDYRLFTYSIDQLGNKQGIYHIKRDDKIAKIALTKLEIIEFAPIENIRKLELNRSRRLNFIYK